MPKPFHLCDEETPPSWTTPPAPPVSSITSTLSTPSAFYTAFGGLAERPLVHPRTPPPNSATEPLECKTPARPVHGAQARFASAALPQPASWDVRDQGSTDNNARNDALKPTPISPPRGNGWDDRKLDVGALLNYLYCEDEQKGSLRAIYDAKKHFAKVYTDINQARAQELLKNNGLDLESLQSLDNKWNVAKTCGKQYRKLTSDTRTRKIYQCACGYHTDARQRRGAKAAESADGDTSGGATISQTAGDSNAGDTATAGVLAATVDEDDDDNTAWKRRAPYPFTGCLAHADVTYIVETGFVLRILGYFEHNTGCQEATMIRFPAIPLHPHVIEVAQEQLRGNASVSQIRNKNLEMLAAQTYRQQRQTDPTTANHRYNLLTSDFRGLYRRHYRDHFGIDINVAPEHNVHNWLDPQSRYFKSEIQEAIFKYGARTRKEERLKLCISTPEMRDAAWRYGHGGQLILDGTFGLCDSRMLLWIAMCVDEQQSGIPVAMFLFSAPTGNKATHAGYDTAILTELLRSWRDWLSSPANAPKPKEPGSDSPIFTPAVAMTDTDTKERGALLIVWPLILLLLCRFHVRQCWTNKRGTLLKPLDVGWRARVEAVLRALEEGLLETVRYEDALGLLAREEAAFVLVVSREPGPEAQKAATAMKNFLAYLRGTWMSLDMWRSWSKKGRADAAAAMGVPIETIIRTSNHLENFNGKLKGAHIPQWQHSGRRLRFDVLTYHLVADILPRMFARHRVANAYSEWKTARFRSAAGGADLRTVSIGDSSGGRDPTRTTDVDFVARTWYEADERRDQAARTLFAERHLSPIAAGCPYELWATCQSAEECTRHYRLTVHPSGAATCACPDWRRRGGACKHLRAFRILIDEWSRTGQLSHQFIFPLTESEAVATEQRNRQWYGNAYSSAVTTSSASVVTEASPDTAIASRSLTTAPPASSAHPPCLLPPAHLDDVVPTTLELALELDNLEASDTAAIAVAATDDAVASTVDHTTRRSPTRPGSIKQAGSEGHEGSDSDEARAAAAHGSGGARTTPPPCTLELESSNQRAVRLQVQSHIEADIAYLLPRLHGLNSILRGSQHVLTPTSDVLEFRAAVEEFSELYHTHAGTAAGSSSHPGPAASTASKAPQSTSAAGTSAKPGTSSARPGAKPATLKRAMPYPLPPSPEPKQKRKKSFKTT